MIQQTTFDFSCLVLTGPSPTLLGMPPEIREIILGHAISDIMGAPAPPRRQRKAVMAVNYTKYIADRKHHFLMGKRTFFALLVTCRRIREELPRVVNEQLKANFNGWRDERSRKQLLDPEKDLKGLDERWTFLLRALMRMDGVQSTKKQGVSHGKTSKLSRPKGRGGETSPQWACGAETVCIGELQMLADPVVEK